MRLVKFGPKGIISTSLFHSDFKRKQLTRGIKCKRNESELLVYCGPRNRELAGRQEVNLVRLSLFVSPTIPLGDNIAR